LNICILFDKEPDFLGPGCNYFIQTEFVQKNIPCKISEKIPDYPYSPLNLLIPLCEGNDLGGMCGGIWKIFGGMFGKFAGVFGGVLDGF